MKKKIFLSIMLAFCLLFSGIMLTACNNDDPVVKIEQASGVVTRIAQNAELDTSAISVTVKFKSGKTETVTSADLTFSALDTSTVGNKTLTITYKSGDKDFTFDVNIEVYDPNEAPTYVVMEYTDPQFVTQYKTNSQLENAYTETGSTGAKGFTVTGNAYLVGNQNAFVYEPTAGVRYSNNQVGEITDHPAVYKVYLWETDAYRLLTTDELATIVTIDEDAHTLKFATTANGRYKISVLPKNVSQDELDNIDASEFEFTVVDGYNVYNAKDLSVLDNTNVNAKWTAYKAANNIPMPSELTMVNRIILQRNIDIEANDIPSVHYWKASEVGTNATDYNRVIGSLKDTTDDDTGYIYRRTLTNGATFTFEGNYFRISAEHLPLIVRERGASTSL
ncbi:MAG: bacterial Ig-like domain-containing protein [bacterium]|nr:bacterial Ig-like domain-containing protein [bacterium]